MFKKILVFAAAILLIAGFAQAAQIDGLMNFTVGPTLPTETGDLLSVYVAPSGDVLLFPYYNVRTDHTNFFQLINTFDDNDGDTELGVAVKVRFREAKLSCEVLDFVVCLSENDVFTFFVTDDGTQARLFSLDTDTLTNPSIPADGEPLKTVLIGTTACDGSLAATAQDRTREGYMEVIGYQIMDLSYGRCPADNSADEAVSTADQDGVAVGYQFLSADLTAYAAFVVPNAPGTLPHPLNMPNTLIGTAIIHDETEGTMYGYSAIALADFNDNTTNTPSLGTDDYTLNNSADGLFADGVMHFAIDPVNFILTKYQIMSPYVIDPALAAESQTVVNLVTRHLSDPALYGPVVFKIFDEEEHPVTAAVGFSPAPPTVTTGLPYEVNVLTPTNDGNTLASGSVFSTTTGIELKAVHPDLGDFNMGWIQSSMATETSIIVSPTDVDGDTLVEHSENPYKNNVGWGSGNEVVAFGLPAIGVVFQEIADMGEASQIAYNNVHCYNTNNEDDIVDLGEEACDDLLLDADATTEFPDDYFITPANGLPFINP